ncbi:MAG: metallophosphoesterase family protein [Myxococcota bacterium]
MSYRWSHPASDPIVRRIPADRPVYVVSDLHLGNGLRGDTFMGKDRELLRLVERAREEGARLVIAGDAIDFLQAHDLTPVVKAHGKLLRALSDMASEHDVIYICGNHDDDFRVYRDFFRFDVCSRLWIGDDVVVEHGHRFDPWIGPNVQGSNAIARFHHFVEQTFHVWIRLPIADFYNWGNRVAFWLFHKWAVTMQARNALLKRVGLGALARRSEEVIDYWVFNEAGDPMRMLGPAVAFAKQELARVVVCGHSHMPANFVKDGVRFVNTGSWTFGWAQYARYAGGEFTVRDWITGREYRDDLYKPLLEGHLDHLTFDRWWRNQYLGWFRFRSGELRRRSGLAS